GRKNRRLLRRRDRGGGQGWIAARLYGRRAGSDDRRHRRSRQADPAYQRRQTRTGRIPAQLGEGPHGGERRRHRRHADQREDERREGAGDVNPNTVAEGRRETRFSIIWRSSAASLFEDEQ